MRPLSDIDNASDVQQQPTFAMSAATLALLNILAGAPAGLSCRDTQSWAYWASVEWGRLPRATTQHAEKCGA